MFNYQSVIQEKIATLKQSGAYRYFLDLNKSAQHFPKFYFENALGQKKQAINWCSNDYLCMSVQEEVIGKLSYVAHRTGAGSGGTRNISGTTIYHRELENTLAKLHQKEAALLFGGAYMANLTTLSTLGKLFPDAVFISDEENHASIIEGIKASGCNKIIFPHNNTIALEQILAELPSNIPKILVFESVYSISGTLAPLEEMILLAKKYHCLSYVDEVHAVGMYGATGAGLAAELGIEKGIDIINGTLAKGFGVIGGYIAAQQDLIDAIRSFGSGFIFTSSLPPAICAAANASIQYLIHAVELRKSFHANIALFRNILKKYQVAFSGEASHITKINIGDAALCKQIADQLLHCHGMYIQPVNFPTVKKGEACFRITVTIKHNENDMIALASALHQLLPANNISLKKKAQEWI